MKAAKYYKASSIDYLTALFFAIFQLFSSWYFVYLSLQIMRLQTKSHRDNKQGNASVFFSYNILISAQHVMPTIRYFYWLNDILRCLTRNQKVLSFILWRPVEILFDVTTDDCIHGAPRKNGRNTMIILHPHIGSHVNAA